MIIETKSGIKMDTHLLGNYFHNLIGLYFKILPLYEQREKTLRVYMEELRDELESSKSVIKSIDNDPLFMSLIVILQCLIDNLDDPEFNSTRVKRKVFGAIDICNKLAARYGEEAE